MNAERWADVERLFLDSLGVDERVRTEWLRARCGEDEDLFREVNTLLRHDLPAEDELRHLIADAADRLEPVQELRIGDHIGPYQLIKEIGKGGMGVVFLAVRADPQFFQTVAIKVLRREFDASQIAGRFLRERQILATLSHPNIAAVLDGGSTPHGTPYLVMEFISGKPITAYAREKRLSVRERVKLFRKVCAAVQHAHRNLIIHRDLKPANVLVGENGEPKLLDFGIAKLIDPQVLPLELPPTETQWHMMTPDYASPEQFRGEVLTTATDVFSLGVLLYELLAGERPFRFLSRDPMDWMNQVCSREPLPPSEVEGVSARDQKEIAGDLEMIVAKAMRKEPDKRYGSPEQLTDDLERWLNGEPVAAQKGTFLYRAEKLVHRYRFAFSGGLLLLAVMAAGLVAVWWQAQRAERRFNELRNFAHAVVFDLDDKIRLLPGATEARGHLIRTSLQFLDNLARDAGDDVELMAELSRAYRKIGDVQGSPFQPNLGDTAAAEQSYRKSLRLAAAVATRMPGELGAQVNWVDSQFQLGRILVHSGGLEEAQRLYEAGRARAEDLARQHEYDPRVVELRSRGAMYLGDVYALRNLPDQALEAYRIAARILESTDATQEPVMREIARAYARVADATAATGQMRKAVQHYERSIDLRETLARRHPENDDYQRDLFNAYISLGALLGSERSLSLYEPREAKPWFERATSIAEALAEKDPGSSRTRVDVAFSYAHLAEVLPDQERERSLELFQKATRMFDDIVAQAPENVSFRQWQARRYEGMGRLLLRLNRYQDALVAYEHALEIRQQVLRDDPARRDLHREIASAACGVASVMLSIDHPRVEYGVQSARTAIETLESEPAVLASTNERATCYEVLGRAAEAGFGDDAGEWYRKAADTWDLWRKRGLENDYAMARFHRLRTYARDNDTPVSFGAERRATADRSIADGGRAVGTGSPPRVP